MQEVTEKAKALGEAVARDPRTKAFFSAEAVLQKDKDAMAILSEYSAHAAHIQESEASGKPIEVADKRKLADLQGRIAANATLKDFTRRQADYVELLNAVNQNMEQAIAKARGGA
jgi:cell fate (sporulation/competence/biofilm development) regulator YlbF (YheA/YmcA/DUF963 family)